MAILNLLISWVVIVHPNRLPLTRTTLTAERGDGEKEGMKGQTDGLDRTRTGQAEEKAPARFVPHVLKVLNRTV